MGALPGRTSLLPAEDALEGSVATDPPPEVPFVALDTLWFQIAGTLCNLACRHCFISCSPTNHTHEKLDLATVESHLEEARTLGVREVYFTGGEPFLHPQMETILARSLALAPTTVLSNGLLIDEARAARLATLERASPYSLDVRISLDGYDAAANDAIRGDGSFARALAAVRALARAGMTPVLTVTEVLPESASAEGRERFLDLLRGLGVSRPRLKILPLYKLGAEAERDGGYADWQRLRASEHPGETFEHLQCSSCRMVTSRGVWVCPILVNEPTARMGERLSDTLRPFPLAHGACWTCHTAGVSCRT
jgi:molybdenum cofactor biosynthesis enzyme MoaA